MSWRRASMARRSSTTPRRRPGPSTSAASAAPSSSTSSRAPCVRRGLETTLLYGVDDMDPMDAQALLSPDAIEREMGRPLAHIPDQVGDGHASYARHHAQTFIDLFSGLGIHPDRYYWMSDIYPTGQMDPFIRTALDRAAAVREIYRRVANVQHPDHWLPVSVVCPNCGKVGHDDLLGLGRRDGRRRVPPRPRRLGGRLRLDRAGRAVRRRGEAALEPRMGRAVEPVRRDDRAQRQGPRDRRRVARPVERDRPRGLRARAAAQLPVRVPQHRRQEDVDLQGAGRGRPHVHRDRAARADAVPVRPASGRRARSTSTPRAPTRSRACSTSSTGWAPRPPAARSRASCRRATTRSSATRCSTRRPTSSRSAGRVPARVRAPRAARPGPGRRRPRRGSRPRRGRALTEAEAAELEVRLAAVRRWLEAYAPERARIEIRRDALPVEAEQLRPEQRGFLRALAEVGPRRRPGDRRAVAGRDLRRRRGPRPRRQGRVQRPLPRVPRPAQRPARRLAAGEPRPRLRDPPPPRGRRARGGDGMSVGVQRLRDEPDRIRQGAIDKREDPAVVDRAIEVDADAAPAPGRVGHRSRPSATRRRKQIGEAIRGGASPTAPRSPSCARRRTARRRADRGHRRRAGGGRGRARRPAAAHPEPRRPRRPGRRRGGERHRPHLGRAGRARGAGRRRRRLDPAAALGARRGARHHRQRPRREDRGLRLPGLQGRRARGCSAR